jgi:hypothetical protein
LGGGRRHVRRLVDQERHVVLVVHAVGDVVVHEEVGQPAVKHLEEGAGFRGVGLHVVAVEVEVAGVGAPAGQLRAVLVDAVIGGAALMAVNVVDGDEDEDYAIEEGRFGPGDGDVAQQGEAGVLAVHLAGVDGVLDEQDGAAGGVDGGGIEDAVLGGDDDLEVAALAGLAEVFDALPGRALAAAMRSR